MASVKLLRNPTALACDDWGSLLHCCSYRSSADLFKLSGFSLFFIPRTKQEETAFSFYDHLIWSKSPESCKNAETLSFFKSNLKPHLIRTGMLINYSLECNFLLLLYFVTVTFPRFICSLCYGFNAFWTFLFLKFAVQINLFWLLLETLGYICIYYSSVLLGLSVPVQSFVS